MNSSDKNRDSKISNLVKLYKEGDMNVVIPLAQELTKEYSSAIAYNILALAYKAQGKYVLAQELYEKLLVSVPESTTFLGNLGNVYTSLGMLDKAEECLKKALEIKPSLVSVAISLGNIFVQTGRLDDALLTFKSLLESCDKITIEELDDVNYRIAEVYRQKGRAFFGIAIHHFNQSRHYLSRAYCLELTYILKDKAAYIEEEDKINSKTELSPLLAAVQTHASIRYGYADSNKFCKDPLEYIYHSKLTTEEGFNEKLVENLLSIKKSVSSVSQNLINNGEQSAGNLLLMDDPSIATIKKIIVDRIQNYRNKYKNSEDGFIKKWPKSADLYGWIVDLKKGGSLNSHMHKLGWLSGSLYLKVEKPEGSSQGNIIFDLDGGSYPSESKLYPNIEFDIEKGDIVLFPSSIFHRTVSFESEKNRVTLAFDIQPIYKRYN